MSGKYSSRRDEILHYLCSSEWANESDGNVDAPTGYFWRISIAPNEISEIANNFDQIIDIPDEQLIGHFFVWENDQGFVHVREKITELELKAQFRLWQKEFEKWDNS